MKRKKIIIWSIVIATLCIFVLGIVSCRGKPTAPNDETESKQVSIVEVYKVRPGEISRRLGFKGDIIASHKVDIYPDMSGEIIQFDVEEGDEVQEGKTVIAVIEHDDISAKFLQAQAALNVAKANQKLAEAQWKAAKKDFERIRKLHQEKVVTEQQLDQVETKLETAEAQKELAAAQVAQMNANLEAARIAVAKATIKASINGIVTNKYMEKGDTASTMKPLVTISDVQPLKVVIDVSEKDLPRIKTEDPASIWVDAYPGEEFTGQISKISPVVDARSRTSQVEIQIKEHRGKLRVGMFARLHLILEKHTDTLLVPADSLIQEQDKQFACIVNNGVVKKVEVVTGMSERNQVEILQGLKEGDLVVTSDTSKLTMGSKVQVVERGETK